MKTIEATLLAHLGQEVTTTCLLVKVECVGTYAGTILGFTDLDIDVSYNDGTGVLVYESDNGFTPKRTQQTSGMAVDNSEIDGVVTSTGITQEQIRSGIFNSAKMTIYRVNWNDLTSGRHEVVAYGRAGETKFNELGFTVEFRSLSQLLKQPISQPYSLTCRAQFGDARCQKAFVWSNGTVSSLGTETDREFSDNSSFEANAFYDGGVIEWLTGDNAGAQMEIDTFLSDSGGGDFALALAMPFAIQVGDTYRRRQDCDKTFAACTAYANTLNFRGENLIPVDGKAMIPGAEINRA